MRIFKRKDKPPADFSFLGTDLHSHVLPGLDDGSPSMEESLKMLREYAEAGFRKIITTPHVNGATYPNTRETILGQLSHLQEVAAENGIPVGIEASAEYHIDYEFLPKVHSGEVIPFGPERYLLVELPFHKPAFPYEKVLYEVHLAGYQPVIAHPERYTWMAGGLDSHRSLIRLGMLFQVNLNSFAGLYGLQAKMTANRLAEAGMISFVGSDAHYAGQIRGLAGVFSNRHFERLAVNGSLLNSSL